MKLIAGGVLFLLLNLHCSTTLSMINDVSENDPTIYGGTQIDLLLIYGGSKLLDSPLDCGGLALLALVGGIIDLPFSLVADTVLLPITIPWYLAANSDTPTQKEGTRSDPDTESRSEANTGADEGKTERIDAIDHSGEEQ